MSNDNPFESPHSGGVNPEQPPSFPVEPHRATMVFVLGLLGILFCPLTGIAAWIMGRADLAAIDAGRMDRSGRDLTKAGFILGIIATCFMVVQLLFLCVWIGIVMSVGAAGM